MSALGSDFEEKSIKFESSIDLWSNSDHWSGIESSSRIMKRSTKLTFLALAGAAFVSVGAVAHNRVQVSESQPPIPSTTRPVESQLQIASIEWSHDLPPVRVAGRLKHADEADLAFLTSGVVANVLVDNGDHVSAGRVLARLVTTDLETLVVSSKAALEAAERDLARSRRLVEEKAIPVSVLDNDRTRWEQAVAAVDAALFALERAEIRAPTDGIILQRFHEPDEIVQAGQPVLSFGSIDTGWVLRAGVPDRDVVSVKLGDRAEIQLDALPDVTLVGSVTEIGRRSDPVTGLFTIEVRVMAPVDRVRSGFIASASIFPSSEHLVARFPVEGIKRADGRRILAVAFDPGTDSFKEVEFSFRRLSGESLVSEDLPGNVHWVVIQGQHTVKSSRKS
jgi:RND family efflux transporter MFP subunit